VARTVRTIGRLRRELSSFAVVGGVGVVVNLVVSNAMWAELPRMTVLGSVIGTAIAMVVTYFGNRHWTYRDRVTVNRSRGPALFLAVNGVGLVIEQLPLLVAHDLLGVNGTLAVNAAKYMVGIPLALVFRLLLYRTVVFPPVYADGSPESVASAASDTAGRVYSAPRPK
jgi:putative flippase GtrA